MKRRRRLCVAHSDHSVLERQGSAPTGRSTQSRRHDFAAALVPAARSTRRGLGDDVREVEQDAPQVRICPQGARQPLSAGHIDNHAETAEVT